MPFDNPVALAALASVIPLIILYLLRPKPLQVQIPSLMFLMDIKEEKKRFYTSISKLVKDPLFFIQLFVLILLALAAASPYFESQEALSGDHTVLIIDGSASMQTDNRFSDAISKAEDYVSKTNTVILAESTPVTIIEEANAQATYDALESMQAQATVAYMSSAISAAMRILSDQGGNIVVVSDFASWNGDDPVNSMKLAESYGLNVQFLLVGREADNIGIIQGTIEVEDGKYNYNGVIKNYQNSRQTIDVEIENLDSGKTSSTSLAIPARSTKQLRLTNLGTGITEVRILDDDSLAADNTAYISIPKISDRQLLFVTDVDDLPSKIALSLIPTITVKELEGVPGDLSDYSIIVIANKERALASNEISLLSTYLNAGGKVVFIASEALSSENAKTELVELLPVMPESVEDTDGGVTLEVVQDTRLSENIKYDEVAMYKYLNVTERIESTTLVATEDDVPMLVYGPVGDGTSVYLGINDIAGEDAWNNFHNLPEYPVFWSKLAGWLGGTGSVQDYNLKTGTVSALAKEQEIQTPSTTDTVSRVLYDEVGVYQVAGKEIAVNLYTDKESDTTLEGDDVIERSQADDEPGIVRESSYTAKNYLDTYMIIIVFALVILELLVIRKRGEL
ncbi:N-terminal double-transmembrane domain-containing protein [Methanolobus tindarius DSM 2278]|uniref:N-terminal double-transmembrane domain-containing protein n=1 Tax=Methanolobus tindarius DSM 2278 TaxID=1090322 RepID=W9DR69_METTI|nr:BatA and WFA domain-containing protein [Methanolobus tindarius]ETA69204.1 N-terminal double-transmembrane domain-containing protein [Methanolobus tindarius DSM 2278]